MVITVMKRWIFLIGIFAILILFSGCNLKPIATRTTPTSTYYWYQGESGVIQTNDANRLQKALPFTLVLPNYLPDDIITNYPPSLVMTPKPDPTTDVQVSIRYQSFVSPHEIDIEEIISPDISTWAKTEPSTFYDYVSFDFAGIIIYEKQSTDHVPFSGSQVQATVFDYGWIWQNISFTVDITGYDQLEARKVIESMIK